MPKAKINSTVLMSGVDYFDDQFAINPYMNADDPVNFERAKSEHNAIKEALQSAGVKVIQVPAPKYCQDGVYTANWALCKDNLAVMSRLPNKRKDEEPYAESVLRDLGKEAITVPGDLRFSGQGDALPCGNFLFAGSKYRTDIEVHKFLAETLGYQVISLQTIPKRNFFGRKAINSTTGWPDSFFYDIDLALSILRAPTGKEKGLIAWCPDAFTSRSRKLLREFDGVDKIEVSKEEAMNGFACNLVSTGDTVIMSAKAPKLKAALKKKKFRVITPQISELAKGGGYIRCTTLTLS